MRGKHNNTRAFSPTIYVTSFLDRRIFWHSSRCTATAFRQATNFTDLRKENGLCRVQIVRCMQFSKFRRLWILTGKTRDYRPLLYHYSLYGRFKQWCVHTGLQTVTDGDLKSCFSSHRLDILAKYLAVFFTTSREIPPSVLNIPHPPHCISTKFIIRWFHPT